MIDRQHLIAAYHAALIHEMADAENLSPRLYLLQLANELSDTDVDSLLFEYVCGAAILRQYQLICGHPHEQRRDAVASTLIVTASPTGPVLRRISLVHRSPELRMRDQIVSVAR